MRPATRKCDKKTKEGRDEARRWAVGQIEAADHAGDAVRVHVDGSLLRVNGEVKVGSGATIHMPGRMDPVELAWQVEGATSAHLGEVCTRSAWPWSGWSCPAWEGEGLLCYVGV